MDKTHAAQCLEADTPILCLEHEYHGGIRAWLVEQLDKRPEKMAYIRGQLARLDSMYGDFARNRTT